MTEIIQELQRQIQLLRLEKEADLEYYRQKVLLASLEDRKRDGVCWYPVVVESQRYSLGEKLIIRVRRSDESTKSHVFTSGKIVSLFSNLFNDRPSVSGVVNDVRKHHMTITLNVSELPSWINEGNLGVDLLFDEMAYREMEKALKKVIETKDPRLLDLRSVLLGEQSATFTKDSLGGAIGLLNESQNQALQRIRQAQDVAVVHGPPGTGKTTTLVQSIIQTVQLEKQVLVCAPSNAAVDLLTEKLSEQSLDVVRLGHPARVTEQNLSRTIDAQIAQHGYYKDLKALRRRSEEMRSLALKYKRNFGHSERQQRKRLLGEASGLRNEAEQLEHYIVADILSKSQVIACTLVGAANNLIKGFRCDTVFIDEAAQALEAACWIPIQKAQRVIFAGDHYQLPPTIKSFAAAQQGLNVTLFEKCIDRQKKLGSPVDALLQMQYRMHQKIMQFSSHYFYDDQLKAASSVQDITLTENQPPLAFVDTAGCGFNEKTDPETLSTFNEEEGQLLLRHLNALVEDLTPQFFLENQVRIGIITPYKAQVKFLTEHYLSYELLSDIQPLITIDTVDAFQGREREIIYISLVRSNAKGEIGFLKDIRRTNVAMTRAKKKLVIFGDSATLGNHPFYSELLDYVQQSDAYQSAFEYIYPG
ncbi:AAA domain-containing protein [Tunicatimonas pelagia]|uniref:AAA domain-containing protein n=1 Tax=Tunicatimonas pelagia TaxID=931531 RepID=UPI0026658E8A|nr:AAA domain-containing protein [Tunicatimonas pelagia]WKN43557.1 AAA domain-containing protein [Tunicatimonas pelagia]